MNRCVNGANSDTNNKWGNAADTFHCYEFRVIRVHELLLSAVSYLRANNLSNDAADVSEVNLWIKMFRVEIRSAINHPIEVID